MRARGWIAATTVVAASGLAFAATAGAGIGGSSEASLSPNPAAPGELVTATSVDACPGGPVLEDAHAARPAGPIPNGDVQWFLTTPDPQSEADVIDDGVVPQAPDGSWSATFNAPDEVGTYEFYASCEEPDLPLQEQSAAAPQGQVNTGDYGPIELVVEVQAVEFSASLDQASGPPGDDIELTAVECAGDSGAAALLPVGEPPASPDDVDEDVLQQYDVVDGQFGGVVPVPDDTEPGTYQVVVWCTEGGRVLDSEVLGYTVTDPAVPAPVAPNFTG